MIESILKDAGDTIALAALFVSFLSICIGAAALTLQHKHNQKTVRPICNITYKDYLDELSIKVSNNGVGPMLVDTVEFVSDKKVFNNIKQALGETIPKKQGYSYRWIGISQQRAVPVEGSIELFRFTKKDTHDNYEGIRNSVREVIGTLTVSVKYSDIYGKSFPRSERKLNNFLKPRLPDSTTNGS